MKSIGTSPDAYRHWGAGASAGTARKRRREDLPERAFPARDQTAPPGLSQAYKRPPQRADVVQARLFNALLEAELVKRQRAIDALLLNPHELDEVQRLLAALHTRFARLTDQAIHRSHR
jgi:hypothetical protein